MNVVEKPGRDEGLVIRNDMIRLLTSDIVASCVAATACPHVTSEGVRALPFPHQAQIAADLLLDVGWAQECWLLDPSENVYLVDRIAFDAAPASGRFSANDCLRSPAQDAWGLRGLLSAVASAEVRESLSAAIGERMRFKSADIARYRRGDYLRRHADIFEDRRFGFVWFLSEGWRTGFGGELVVESPSGKSTVVPPVAGTFAVLRIDSGYFHQVAAVSSDEWVRYSIATHFAVEPLTN